MEFKTYKVKSSNIDEIGWADNTLYIKFTNGLAYKYLNFPEQEFTKFLTSESKGSYFWRKVRDKYTSLQAEDSRKKDQQV